MRPEIKALHNRVGGKRGSLRVFFSVPLRRQVTLIGCLILAGLAEGIGIAGLLPVLSIAAGGAAKEPSAIDRAVAQAFSFLGLPLEIGPLLVMVVIGLLMKAAFSILAMNYVGYVVAEIATGLRMSLIDRLLGVRWSYFTRQPLGRFANAISNEAARASEAFLSSSLLVAYALQTALYLVLALIISWKLGLFAAGIGAVMAFGLNRLVTVAKRAGRQQTKHTQMLVSRLTDMLGGIKALRAMARHVRLGALLAVDARDLNRALRRQVFAKQLVRSLQEPILGLFLAIALYIAIKVWNMPVKDLVVMGLLLARTVSVMGKAQISYQAAVVQESAYWGMRDIIREAEDNREAVVGTEIPSLENSLEFDRVSFAFGDKPVLTDACLVVPAGRITTITGPSGAGKTTIADLVLGLIEPSRGQVRLDGRPLDKIDLSRWRGMVGYVPQEVILFHDSILANVTLEDPNLTRAQTEAALKAAGAWDFVSRLPAGMDSMVGERGALLSGGQRQRIAVARALVHRPTLLILDEATSALDPETEALMCSNLKDLGARTGLTLLAISHQAAWIEAADRVYHLANGRAVENPARLAASAQ
jgi:ATP-binding cassette subfamily C protein